MCVLELCYVRMFSKTFLYIFHKLFNKLNCTNKICIFFIEKSSLLREIKQNSIEKMLRILKTNCSFLVDSLTVYFSFESVAEEDPF